MQFETSYKKLLLAAACVHHIQPYMVQLNASIYGYTAIQKLRPDKQRARAGSVYIQLQTLYLVGISCVSLHMSRFGASTARTTSRRLVTQAPDYGYSKNWSTQFMTQCNLLGFLPDEASMQSSTLAEN